jgi:hypothetical protein
VHPATGVCIGECDLAGMTVGGGFHQEREGIFRSPGRAQKLT